jgi:hypothetical protein
MCVGEGYCPRNYRDSTLYQTKTAAFHIVSSSLFSMVSSSQSTQQYELPTASFNGLQVSNERSIFRKK